MLPAATPRGLWVWDATVLTDPARGTALLDFCRQHGIGTLYLSLGDIFSVRQREASDPRHVSAAQLGAFARSAHAQNVEIEGLDGDPSFALTENHPEALGRFTRALAYNGAAPPDERLDGWQWDIEPYVLKEFKADPAAKPDILIQYLEGADQMCVALKASPNLRLGYTLPFFFDSPDLAVTWHGENKPPAFLLLDDLEKLNKTGAKSYVALMAYRDHTDGPNGSIAISRADMDYAAANAPHVKVWIGQEVSAVTGDPPTISFWGKGTSALETAALQIEVAFRKSPNFGGIAIDHYRGYQELLARPATTPAAG